MSTAIIISPEFLAEVAAASQRVHERELAWLRETARIIEQARLDLEADLDRYDERKAREPSDYELDCIGRARDMKEAQR